MGTTMKFAFWLLIGVKQIENMVTSIPQKQVLAESHAEGSLAEGHGPKVILKG